MEAEAAFVAEEATPRKRGRGNSVPLVVGNYVTKNFPDGSGTLLGKVVSGGGRYYSAVYEDGRREELEIYEIRRILLSSHEEEKLAQRKEKLEQILSEEAISTRSTRRKVESAARAPPDRRRRGRQAIIPVVQGEDVDSSTDSSESVVAPNDPNPVPSQALELPPSSNSLDISEDSVGCLLSVYSFLRAFSVALFLSPFGLDDFVGSLNCTFQNSLLDAIHVSLMRALRRHLDVLSADASQPASRSLRRLDWTMLDTLTWPVYVLEYLHMRGLIRGREWKEFRYGQSEEEEYYSLSAVMKLKILQILCDAVLDSGELRAELDSRKEADEEGEYADHGDSAVKENIIPKEADLPEDGNSDECRICGMDGTLICCDGCPSAYHSRCIGLGKASLPDGPWFCPECAANQTAPEFAKMTLGIRGSELFGIDPYGRAFVGACNYLLVLNASASVSGMFRYYNRDDVREVLKFLCSSEDYSLLYADICKEIATYWAISMDEYCFPTAVSTRKNANPSEEVEESRCYSAAKASVDSGRESISNVTQITPENGTALQNMDADMDAGVTISENGSANQAEDKSTATGKLGGHVNALTYSSCADNRDQAKLPHMIDQDSDLLSSRSFSRPSSLTDMVHQKFGDYSSPLQDFVSSTPSGTITIFRDDADSQILSSAGDRQTTIPSSAISGCSALLETGFHTQTYANQYLLGEVAASAAADLVALDLEKGMNNKSVGNSSSLQVRQRKLVSATIATQLKAFARASARFVWTHAERRLLEGPKERCGWCISCKGEAINKKGCLLNLASLHAAKAALIRGHTGIRPPVKICDKSHISAIATHILNMADHLSGLVIGQLVDPVYRKWWSTSVRDASSCRVLRSLLLELEKSIRRVVFSADWFKPFDEGLIEHVLGRGAVMPVQKRGPGRPKIRKLVSAEPMLAASVERLSEFNVWWRGVRLSRVLFQRGCLSRSLAKKTARQGGVKCISGVNYSGNSYIPRTRQLAWRAGVEMSMSASQLALQVRGLDAHLRWKDLVRPEQIPSEMAGKGAESDSSAFRNAVICGVQASSSRSKTRYALVFGDLKHLPSSVSKNILEMETDEDSKEKLWFAENNVPLYLIKEYEERTQKEGGISSAHHHHPTEVGERSSSMRQFQRRQLRAFRRDIFSYLLSREDNPLSCSCASCSLTLLVKEAVRCSTCQGYCHEGCLFGSTSAGANPKRDSLCKQCHLTLFPPPTPKNGEHLKNNTKIIALAGSGAALAAPVVSPGLVRQLKVRRNATEASPDSSRRRQGAGDLQVTHGLVWRRRKNGDDGEHFRLCHVIPKGGDSVRRPVCVLCAKDYDPSAMYIRCERCLSWVHAAAVQLEEEQAKKLVGFKCGKCRRKSTPRCPYQDARQKKHDSPSPNGLQKQPRFLLPQSVAPAEVKVEEFAAAQKTLLHEDADMNTGSNMDMRMGSFINTDMDMGVDIDLDFDIDVDVAMNMNMEASMSMNMDAMESEPPQTYFSFTELLEAPDDSHLDAQLEELQRSLLPSLDLPPELVCQTCGVARIPWPAAAAAGLDASAALSWKCVACRDWQ